MLAKSQVKTLLNMSQIEVSKFRRIRNCPGKPHIGRPAGRPMSSRSVDRPVDRSPAHPTTESWKPNVTGLFTHRSTVLVPVGRPGGRPTAKYPGTQE